MWPIDRFVAAKQPEHARIVVFQGSPKPADARDGFYPKRRRRIAPATWIADHWHEG